MPVTVIGDSSFWNCKSLTSVTIPDSIERIDKYAFDNCIELASVHIPDSVVSIGNSAFEAFKGTIYGFAGSTVQEFAEKKGYKFSILTLGDVDGDGAINSSDASSFYASTLLSLQEKLPRSANLRKYPPT